MSGRPRKPKIIKLHQGTFRPDREVGEEPEPTMSSGVRNAPSHIGKYGKRLWDELAEELVSSGIMSEVDWQSLEICCESYNMFREARDAIYKPVYRTCTECGEIVDDGYCPQCGSSSFKMKVHAQKLAEYLKTRNSQTGFELTTMHKGKEQFLKYAIQLGLTPVARNRIDISGKKPEEKSEMELMWEESHG